MNVDFFSRLKIERKKLHLSQIEIAERCNVSATTYSNYELGKRKPDAEFLQKFSDIGGDVHFLFTGKKVKGLLEPLENMALLAFNRLKKDGHKANAVTYMAMLESGHLKGGLDELEKMAKPENEQSVVGSIQQSAVIAGSQNITSNSK